MSLIGYWVTRKGLTRSHLVESEIAGAIVTHCGRRIEPKGEWVTPPFHHGIQCQQCDWPFTTRR